MDGVVTLEIPAKAEYLVLCRLALAGLLRDLDFSEEAISDLKLALTEACSNSVRHAYAHRDGDTGSVHVSFEVLSDRVVLVVDDDGAGFVDATGEEAPPLPNGRVVASEGGMGIALIRAIVDDFELEQPESGGTRVTLTKLCDE